MEPIEIRLPEAPLGRRDVAYGAILVISAITSHAFGAAPLRILAYHHVRGDLRLRKEPAPPGGRLPSKHLPRLHSLSGCARTGTTGEHATTVRMRGNCGRLSGCHASPYNAYGVS